MATPTNGQSGPGTDRARAGSSLAELWKSHRSSANASEAVYLALRDVIAAGTIKPGEHLGEPAIAESLGISRTPIREALLRLETERFVERTAGRRLVVATVSPEEVVDVYAVREALNGLAARLAAENASTTDMIRLRRLHREMKWALDDGDTALMARLNFEFHDAVCVASRNAFLLEMLRKAHDTHHRYPGSTFSLPDRATGSLEEHELILQAIEAGDGRRAGELAQHHTAKAREARIAMLDGTVEELHRNRRAKESADAGTGTETDAETDAGTSTAAETPTATEAETETETETEVETTG
ncbi:GntR family transcriptional regulator [Streptomyces nanshensis]|uniref:GntR family transcriptional regulator n=1 Tax=Streptomyces nanshensis TaxID=518642 RepID=UPI00114CF5A3|nr:GntR family transcriptional regulator [Streptomyces nanshensis]